jgi:hypothetical protein
MLLDYQLVLSDAQAVTTTAATTNSTYYVDTLAAGDAVLPGAMFEALVDTSFVSGGSGTLQIQLRTATSSDLATGGATLIDTGAISKATCTAKTVLYRGIIPEGVKRYLFVTYTVATSDFTAGKIDSRIVLEGDRTLDKKL